MALPIFNIPVLTGEVAEKFIEQCEYNSKYLAGSEWSQEREERFNKIMEKFNSRKINGKNDSDRRS